MQQNFKNVYNFGNGWWGSGHNTQIFCGNDSLEGAEKDSCGRKHGHIQVVRKYAEGNDALMFCKCHT
jgi:hypothetical protein